LERELELELGAAAAAAEAGSPGAGVEIGVWAVIAGRPEALLRSMAVGW
jgi:hypothetical protein